VADKIAAREKLPFHSLAIAPHTNGWFVHARHISFRGPAIGDQPNVPNRWRDPYQLFQALFADGKTGPGVDPAKVAELLARRKSVFDFVGKQLESFSQVLGSDDRQKVQAHIEGVRSVERQLSAPTSKAGACTPPSVPSGIDLKTNDHNGDWNKIIRAFSDLVLAAFRCDLTRVAAPYWGDSANNGVTFFWLGKEFSSSIKYDSAGGSGRMLQHHSLGHHGERDATYVSMKNAVDGWFISEFAYILGEMKKVPEGTGTMLDNSALLLGNLMSHGGSHSTRRLPWILAGRAAGQFRTGRYLKQPRDVPHNGVLVALANAMLDGTQDPLKYFGSEKYGGELAGLRGA
jgi:hypothetical protein